MSNDVVNEISNYKGKNMGVLNFKVSKSEKKDIVDIVLLPSKALNKKLGKKPKRKPKKRLGG